MELYLLRHAETEWSRLDRHTSTIDLSLTERGREQAAQLAKKIEGISFEEVYTSPMKRAVETCFLKGAIRDSDLVEWNYGEYEGLTSSEIAAKNPSWSLFEKGAPGGETVVQVEKRADRFLQKLFGKMGNIAIFSHGHFSRVLAARFLGLSAKEGRIFYLSVASLSVLGFEHEKSVVKLWNSSLLKS